MQRRNKLALAKQGQSILTIVAETYPCEAEPLLSESDEIYDLGEMSDERLTAFMQAYMTGMVLSVSNAMSLLPDSVRSLFSGLMTLE